MSFNRKEDDNGNTRFTKAGDISTAGEFVVEFADGVDATVFRGTTDTDITGFILRNASGTAVYVYPNPAGDGLVASTTRP